MKPLSKLRKKPYVTNELFEIIVQRLKDNGDIPDILDYISPASSGTQLLNEAWSVYGKLEYGGNEGIYLTMLAEIYSGESDRPDTEVRYLGTFKTLLTDRASFMKMAALLGSFVFETNQFVQDNLDDFNWIGYDLMYYRDGKPGDTCWTVVNEKRALALISEYKTPYDYALLVDNRTKKFKKIVPEKRG